MPKINVTVTQEVKKEVEVTFPIFRKHDCSGDDYSCVIYTSITEDMRFHSITKRDNYRDTDPSYEIESGRYSFDGRSGEDYCLGKGEYACTKAEYDEIVDGAMKHLSGFYS
jgi:hypothetical protein